MARYILILALILGGLNGFAFSSKEVGDAVAGQVQLSRPSETLSLVFAEEKPTQWQKEQINTLVADITRKAAVEKFVGYPQLLQFINSFLPKGKKDTFLLKDAFAESAEVKPRGSLDCDARGFLALAVIEKLNYPFGKIYLADLHGHAVLFSNGDYFDMNINELIKPEQEDLLKINILNTRDKIRSLLIANKAGQAYAASFSITSRNIDDAARGEAQKQMAKALALDPKNLTALYNLSVMEKDVKYKMQLVGIMSANYFNLFSEKPLPVFANQEVNIRLPQKDNKAEEALKASEAIRLLMLDIMGDALHEDKYDITVRAGEMLTSAGFHFNGFVPGFMAKALFAQGRFKEARAMAAAAQNIRYRQEYPADVKDDFDSIFAALDEEIYVSDIIEGRININNIKLYQDKSVIIRSLFDGQGVNIRFIEPMERFRSWKGCGALLDAMGRFTPLKKEDFCK